MAEILVKSYLEENIDIASISNSVTLIIKFHLSLSRMEYCPEKNMPTNFKFKIRLISLIDKQYLAEMNPLFVDLLRNCKTYAYRYSK